MKYFYKVLIVLSVIVNLSVIGLFFGFRIDSDVFFDGEIKRSIHGSGKSMLPTMPEEGDYIGYKLEPKVGDIIGFYCSKPECLEFGGVNYSGKYIKRLDKIRDDGAWWVEGDNSEVSFDSTYFGWILPSERTNVWVIKL